MNYGITIDNIYDAKLEDKLKTIPKETEARIVIDKPCQDYVDIIPIIASYCHPFIQVLDSFNDAKTTGSEFRLRCSFIKNNFNYPIEISNEPNGIWNGLQVINRMKYANEFFKDRRRIVTLYCQSGMLEWWNKNKIDGPEIWLSFYPDNVTEFLKVMDIFTSIEAKGISEFGTEEMNDPKPADKLACMFNAKTLKIPVNYWDWQNDFEMWNKIFVT